MARKRFTPEQIIGVVRGAFGALHLKPSRKNEREGYLVDGVEFFL